MRPARAATPSPGAPLDCGAGSGATTVDQHAPTGPTCSHQFDHSCAYAVSTPPSAAGWPPPPRVPRRRWLPAPRGNVSPLRSPPAPGVRLGRTRLAPPASSAETLRLASPLANPKCSNGSIGLPNPLPPSAGPDWSSVQAADPLLLGLPALPSIPAFLSVSPPAPPVLPWVLAALGAELSPASLSVPSSWQTCYSFSRVDLLILRDCTTSALITGSLTPSVIGIDLLIPSRQPRLLSLRWRDNRHALLHIPFDQHRRYVAERLRDQLS